MAKLGQLLEENVLNQVEKLQDETQNTSVGRELINNLMYRINRRGNIMVEMEGFFVSKIRIPLSSNFFDKNEKNFHLWVKPFPQKASNGRTYLMFKVLEPCPAYFKDMKIRASDYFGPGINRVRLNG